MTIEFRLVLNQLQKLALGVKIAQAFKDYFGHVLVNAEFQRTPQHQGLDIRSIDRYIVQ
jgi:hypothetical protein